MKFIKIVLLIVFLTPIYEAKSQQQKNFGLAIHGGAGNISKANINDEQEMAYRQKLSEALEAGYTILERGGSSIDAVTTVIQLLEESPLFNAGRGAVLTNKGEAELDASIMDGKTGLAGAVAGVTTIRSPILAARAVMLHSPHVMLSGPGAEQFARDQGLDMVDPSYFLEEKRLEQLKKIQEKEKKDGFYPAEKTKEKHGTVGAVALDKDGNLAAGTSTGGMFNKRYGRIGDSPIIGAGTYADNSSCAVSATGHGEYFIRNVVAYDIAAQIKYTKLTLKEAANKVIMEQLPKQGGEGGIIAIDGNGQITMPFNTEGMFRGYMLESHKPQVFLFKE